MATRPKPSKAPKPRKQIAALPVAPGPGGEPRVLVITSRETQRFIVPKGWPMKGVKDHRVAEIEAREEAGLVGRARTKPVGSYLARKRRASGDVAVRVKVFLFTVDAQLEDWKEKGQRELAWLGVEAAAMLLDERGMAELVLDLPKLLPKSWTSRSGAGLPGELDAGTQPSATPDTA